VDGDVSKKETAIKVVGAALKHFGRIHLLVNSAGIYMPKAFTDYTEEDYNLVMNTNVASFFYMTRQVISQLKKQNTGHVVSISGVSVDQPSGAATELLAVLSKAPMPAASKALALEYAANNIRFNAVSSAVVNTPFRLAMSEPSPAGQSYPWIHSMTGSFDLRCTVIVLGFHPAWSTKSLFEIESGQIKRP
jgi:NAD(P)-dependent dehydrogenase (short-subunit alcohol dehydrogenase family)